MKEFVEKMIGRLEEYKYSHLVEHDKERLEHCTEDERAEHCEGIDCFWCVWNKSIEIVNQLAEEYKDKEYCWQECASTEHCKECSRLGNGDIDYFESIDDWAESLPTIYQPKGEQI